MAEIQQEGTKRMGRPPVAGGNTEVLHVIVPRELMADVRERLERDGGTIAWFVRRALRTQLDLDNRNASS